MSKKIFFKIFLQFFCGLLLFIGLRQVRYTWDLTADGRHTLHPQTIEILKNLENSIQIHIYLAGDLPQDYKKLKESTESLLENLKRYTKFPLTYRFIDPYQTEDEKKREELLAQLEKEGLQQSVHEFEENDGFKRKIIVPAGLIYYQDRKFPIQLLQGQFLSQTNPFLMEQAVQKLEYLFAQTLAQVTQKQKKKIGFTQSNQELERGNVKDIFNQISQLYQPEFVQVGESAEDFEKLLNYDLLLIAKPLKPYTEAQKYLLDQYLMRGKKIIWLISTVQVQKELLQRGESATVEPIKLNLDDLFFKYGIKIQYNLVADAFCLPLQLPAGQAQGKTLFKEGSWYFHPLINSLENHSINRNIDPVLMHYTSSLESVIKENQKLTTLLTTSMYSTVLKVPTTIQYQMALYPLEKMASQYIPHRMLGVLVEGHFNSLYENRPLPVPDIPFISEISEQSLIVISDGELIYNAYNPSTGAYIPVGFDFQQNEIVYGNMAFVLNAIDDLIADFPLQELRLKNIEIRPLDLEKVKKEKTFWRFFNLILPLCFVILMALIFWFWRRGQNS